MPPQAYDWTCSVCSFTWVVNALENQPDITRENGLRLLGYPTCVNETYGCMSSECIVDAFESVGLDAAQAWVTFDQAYAIASAHTGVINPVGMYHYMALRGVRGGSIWVANSAQGYRGVWEDLDREMFNALGPVQVVWLPETVLKTR